MDDLDRLVRRVRHATGRDWSRPGFEERVRRAAADLAAIGAGDRPLPHLPRHVLPDALAVLGRDALDSDAARTAEVVRAAREALE